MYQSINVLCIGNFICSQNTSLTNSYSTSAYQAYTLPIGNFRKALRKQLVLLSCMASIRHSADTDKKTLNVQTEKLHASH